MTHEHRCDWNPDSRAVFENQIAAYDELRRRCPVAHSDALHCSLLRHADVMRALEDPETFSNSVSAHLCVPNGMDPPEHTDYRRMIDPYFSTERMRALEPRCRDIAAELIEGLPKDRDVEMMVECAELFALRCQCAFLDWPHELHEPLRQWTRKNHAATRSRDRAAMAAVALEFDSHIRSVLDDRRKAGADASPDVASRLLREQVRGRALTDAEIMSVLRNWTVGELATMSACVGILAHYLAERPALQTRLREQRSLLPAAIDEILRIHPPLIASRRIATKAIDVDGWHIDARERITLMWASANRDEGVFGNPDEFDPDRNAEGNLLYGAGIHVCPGAPLARLELRVFIEELLARVSKIAPGDSALPVRATYPASGFVSLPLRLSARRA